jgi:Zn-dependent M28 family amino/carboxypeptidase
MKPAQGRAVLGVVLSVLLVSGCRPPVAKPAIRPSHVDRAVLMDVVRRLSSPEFEGRAMGTRGGARARAFIARRFQEMDLTPLGRDGTFFQPVDAAIARSNDAPVRSRDLGAANVLGLVKGTRRGSHAIAVSAHYDHLGIVDGVLYPGADDNASGVAVLLAAALHFEKYQPRHDFVFVAFDGEELNLAGSNAFVAHPPIPIERIRLVVNLDMVARGERREIFAAGTSHHPTLRPVLDDVRRRAPVRLLFGHDRAGESQDDWTQDSDHWPFHKAGVPFVYFGVEDHGDYHRPTDTADRIDASFFGDVANTIVDALIALDGRLE